MNVFRGKELQGLHEMNEEIEKPQVQSNNPDDLKRMITQLQSSNRQMQLQIGNLMKSNEIKRLQNKKLKDNTRVVDAEMKQLVSKNLKDFEEKIEAEKAQHHVQNIGISPFALSRLPSFKFQAGRQSSICMVCFAELQNNQRCKILPQCRHMFHSNCIKEHLMVSKMCPGCGEEVHL